MKTTGKKSLALLLTGTLLAGFLSMGTEEKSRAAEQIALRNPRKLKTAQEVAPGLGGKKDLNNPTMEKGVTTWDCIWFGNYWQEDTNGDGKVDKKDKKTPIKWRVLSVEGDDAFLVADKNLDRQRYNDENDVWAQATWGCCTMRSWLNGYGAENNKEGKDYSNNNFLNNAFTANEQSAIRTTNVVNNDTTDKVYLLSLDEVQNPVYGFTSDYDYSATRVAVNTAYTAGGGEIGSEYMSSAGKADSWWLLGPGYYTSYAFYVHSNGYVDSENDHAVSGSSGVRPALHLNLKASSDARSASSWSYAGSVLSDEVSEWDCIWFGNYWQEDTNGDGEVDKKDKKTPIKWRVLSVEGDDVFLVADKNLDCQRYNDTEVDVTWETCTMRSWLNGYGAESNKEGNGYSGNNFLNNAFSANEQSAIKTTNVVNNDNPEYGTDGGNDTTDKVYLLSLDEVQYPAYGFALNDGCSATRVTVNTAYTSGVGERGSESWWLRSPGNQGDYFSYVAYDGDVSGYGYPADGYYIFAVRPALHISASNCSYAGTVTSDGEVSDVATPTPDRTISPNPTKEPNVTASPKPTEKPNVIASPKPTGTTVLENPKPTDETNTTNSPLEGTVLEDSKSQVSYKVTGQDKTVAFYQVKNKKTTKIVIPPTVTMNGTTYKVTSISDNAFSGCKKLKSVTIGKSVTTIGNKAFFKCISLKKMTLPASIIKIGKKAFYGCKKLKSITIKSKKLKSNSVGTQAFKAINKKAVIKVPKKQKKEYEKWLKKKGIKKMKIK